MLAAGLLRTSPAPAAAVPTLAQEASAYRQLTSQVVNSYANTAGTPGTPRFYANGVWQNGDASCGYCNVGPAVGAAYLPGADPATVALATNSLTQFITDHRQPDGSFDGGSSAGINAGSFALMLGMAYVRLGPKLDDVTRTLWQQTLTGVADFLIGERDISWYANGNINLTFTTNMYFAWRASGQQRYLDAYNAALAFTIAPTAPQWTGFGLVITTPPTLADGSDGAGYLTEGSTPGWDPEYSQLQLDFLSVLYTYSRDPRVLRLLNLILNQELTRVDPSTFTLDATGGTRRDELMAFTSASLPLLVLNGSRPDLAPLLAPALARLTSEYRASMGVTEHNFYRGVALWLAPILAYTGGVAVLKPPQAPAQN